MTQPTIIFVTGAAGYVGVNTCLQLAQNPTRRVVGLVRQRNESPEQQALRAAGIELHTGDLTDAVGLLNLLQQIKPQAVVHLAADITKHPNNMAGLIAVNVQGFANLLQALSSVGGVAKVLYASTYSVYGLQNSAALQEAQPLPPAATPYATSKQMVELLAAAWSATAGIPTVGLRFFHVLGPWARASSIIAFFAEKLRQGEPVPLFAEGQLVRDFVSVADVARTLEKLLAVPTLGAEVFNVGTGRGHTTLELLTALAHAMGLPMTTTLLGLRAHEPAVAVADPSKLQKVLGWHPTENLAQIVAQFVHWQKQPQRTE
jgi:UDP-glucuronate 4-epimerase